VPFQDADCGVGRPRPNKARWTSFPVKLNCDNKVPQADAAPTGGQARLGCGIRLGPSRDLGVSTFGISAY
jgi:hypothetical protein